MRTVVRASFLAWSALISLLSVAAAQTPPPPRFGHTLTNVGGTVYLFGGTSASAPAAPGRSTPCGDLLNDLWAYTDRDRDWTKIEPSGLLPPARHSHAAVAHDDLLYIIGGYGASGALDDIWSYDPLSNEWTQGTWTSGTWVAPKRYEHTAVSLGGFVYTYGGRTSGGSLTSTGYRYDPATSDGGQWTAGTGPMSRRGCASAAVENAIYVFGGFGGLNDLDYQYRNDVWRYLPGGGGWALVENVGPGPDGRANAGYEGIGARFFIVGGEGAGGTTFGDVWAFNTQSGRTGWTEWGTLSSPRTRTAVAPLGSRALAFGGWNGQTFLGDTELFRTSAAYPGDFSGDGTEDIAVFRLSDGLWSVRNVTRFYFGSSADAPAPRDYDGDRTSDAAVFRGSTGLCSVRNVTRCYFGGAVDVFVTGDYDGDGKSDVAIFRPSTGLWSVRDLTRFYFGSSGDNPAPADYRGRGMVDPAIFRPSTGLWSVRDLTRYYFGGSGDAFVPGDYDGDGTSDIGIWRTASGLWSIRDLTRAYLGSSGDWPRPGDYDGDGREETGIFRPSTGMWSVRDLTRFYFGSSGDIPVGRSRR